MNKLYSIVYNDNEVVLEAVSLVAAPSVEEFKNDYNAAYDVVSDDESLVNEYAEFTEIVNILVATGKYRVPHYTAIIQLNGELEPVDMVEGIVISPNDDELPGLSMEQLDALSEEFKHKE